MYVNTIDKAMSDMTKAVRKNTQESECIDIFCDLLTELHDRNYVGTLTIDMNHFIEHFMRLCKQIDLLSDKALKAQLLTYDFIKPEQYFKHTLQLTNNAVLINAAINAFVYFNDEEKGAQFYDIHKSKLGNLKNPGKLKPRSPEVISAIYKFKLNHYNKKDFKNIAEDIRKVILCWNYCATVVKAIIQTKRRSLGLDNNSKRFK